MLTRTAKIRQGSYVLAGQSHLLGKSNEFWAGGAFTFLIQYSSVIADDATAIVEAENFMSRERAIAKTGWVVGGTLHQDQRLVKNFPARET